jgi:AcrR family transcriptional regulator
MSSARDRWLDLGLDVLATDGPSALRIDPLAARLGLSKGSFFHHFASAAAFRSALLARYETEASEALALTAARLETAGPAGVLRELAASVGTEDSPLHPELEVAVRAWSYSDPAALAVQTRVDAARLSALEAIWHRLLDDHDQARIYALVPYLIMVGASMSSAEVTTGELRRIYELIFELVQPRLPRED